MAKTEQELKDARKARRVVQRAAKKAGLSTKEFRAKLEAGDVTLEAPVAEEAVPATA